MSFVDIQVRQRAFFVGKCATTLSAFERVGWTVCCSHVPSNYLFRMKRQSALAAIERFCAHMNSSNVSLEIATFSESCFALRTLERLCALMNCGYVFR